MKALRAAGFPGLLLVLAGCELFGIFPSGEEENPISYYSREVEFSTYVDPDGYFLEPVERRIYGERGTLEAIFRLSYSNQEPVDEPFYANDKTEVYEVDDAGTETLVEYYVYGYQRDDWDYQDEEGTVFSTFDYILNRGESHLPEGTPDDTSDDILTAYYDVTYTTLPNDYDVYTLIEDRDGSDVLTAQQTCTYITDGGGAQRYRTEKYFSRTDPESDILYLEKEFAAWYDAAEPYDYLYELYHSFYGVQGSATEEEFIYLTLYSRDENGFIYEQADFNYADTGIPFLVTGDYTNGSFNDTAGFTYDIDFANLGSKANVLQTRYDSRGNIIEDIRSYNGQVSERIEYRYNADSELIDKKRYTGGGSQLRDRTTITYRDEYLDGVYYRIKETCVFMYYDYEATDQGQTSSSMRGGLPRTRLVSTDDHPLGSDGYRKDFGNEYR